MRIFRNVFVAMLVCSALTPAASQAAVVGANWYEGVTYSADPGEANAVKVSREGDRFVIEDPGADIRVQIGCRSITPTRVTCERTHNLSGSLTFELGDRDDTAVAADDLEPVTGAISFYGGAGDDELSGSATANYLFGDAGRDAIRGGAGTRIIRAVDIIGYQNEQVDPTVLVEADTVSCVSPKSELSIDADRLDAIGAGCPEPRIFREPEPIGEGSKRRGKCRRSSTSGGARIITRSKYGVVFAKRQSVYGCLYSAGRIARLFDEGAGIDRDPERKPVLNGRYAVYPSRGSAIGDEFDRVVVWDLRQGRVLYKANSTYVRKVVVKKNGSVAWIANSPLRSDDSNPQLIEVWQISTDEPQGEVLIDRGTDVDPRSLRLAKDSLSVSWTRGGRTKSAPLR